MSGVGDPLRDYLRACSDDLSIAWYPFAHTGDRIARLERFIEGVPAPGRCLAAPRWIPTLARDFFANFWWFLRKPRSQLFIGVDNVNATCGILLKWLGKTDRVVFYVIDYTRRRFKNPLLNRIYHWADAFSVRFSDEIWNISPRIAEVRAREQGVDPSRNKVVPNGVDLSIIPGAPSRREHDLVMMAHLIPEKGVQTAIAALPAVRAALPDARLIIIGDGPYRSHLERLSEELGVEGAVIFYGLLGREEMYRRLVECGVGLAPYTRDPDSITYFADPGKPKEYLACGLPVITTDVPSIAQEIRDIPLGAVAPFEPEGLAEAILALLADASFYRRCVANAAEYARRFQWSEIFDRALADARKAQTAVSKK